jgi:hypothetical protein
VVYKINEELTSVELDAVDTLPFSIVISNYGESNLVLHFFLNLAGKTFDR